MIKNTGVSMLQFSALNKNVNNDNLDFSLFGGGTTGYPTNDDYVCQIINNSVNKGVDIRQFLTNGTNHLAAGRQKGIWQVWINGTRVYRSSNKTANNASISASFNHINISQHTLNNNTLVVNDIRLASNVNIYGDSATITVPSLPLTAI
jgi:hypothetical protein